MTFSKTDLARRMFDAFAQRDVDRMLEVIGPEAEFYAPTAELANEGRPYVGHDGMRQYLEDVERIWQELDVMPNEFREVDEHVIAFGRVYGRGEGGYIQDSPAQWVIQVRGEKIVRIEVFTNRSAALAAVGLEE